MQNVQKKTPKELLLCFELHFPWIYQRKRTTSRKWHQKRLTFWRSQSFPKRVLNSLVVLLHNNPNILLHKPLSAPSFGRYWKQLIWSPYFILSEDHEIKLYFQNHSELVRMAPISFLVQVLQWAPRYQPVGRSCFRRLQ